jgi:DNA-binding transcriptional ArsR family regulator
VDLSKCENYLDIVKMKLEENSGTKGYQSIVARAGGFHTSHFSLVLSEKAHLSLEQATAVCNFWGFNYAMTDYFLTLVSLSKSGTSKLREHLLERLRDIRPKLDQSYLFPKELNEDRRTLSPEDAAFFWKSWHCGAIQACISLNIDTVETIVQRLSLPPRLVTETLARMETMGLVKRSEQATWQLADMSLVKHASKDLAEIFQTALRDSYALSKSDRSDLTPIRSGMMGILTPDDAALLKKQFEEGIRATAKIISKPPTGEETEIVTLCWDYFTF